MFVQIITTEEKLYEGNATSVRVPGSMGSFQVFANHAPLVSTLAPGHVRVVDTNNEEHHFEVKGGVIENMDDNVVVLPDR